MSTIPEPSGLIEVRVDPKNDVVETIQNQLHTLNIKSAAIVSIVGTITSCRLINKPRNRVKSDIYTDLVEEMDLSGNGEVRDGKALLRVILSGETGKMYTGTLHSAKSKLSTVSVYVLPMH